MPMIAIGMLAPGRYITVQISYITELQIVHGENFKFLYKTVMDNASLLKAHMQQCMKEVEIYKY